MRFVLLILFSCSLFFLQAQSEQAAPQRRASVGIQMAFDNYGGMAEVYLKPKMSAWVTVGVSQVDRQLSFGEDTTGSTFFRPPLETMDFDNIQQRTSIRLGVRLYETTKKERWSVWYSPVLGYSNLTAPTDSYQQAYQREDLHFQSRSIGLRKAKQTLDLGGEIGARWLFWRKPQTNSGLFLEGSALMLGKRSLLNDRTDRDFATGELRVALGYSF